MHHNQNQEPATGTRESEFAARARRCGIVGSDGQATDGGFISFVQSLGFSMPELSKQQQDSLFNLWKEKEAAAQGGG